MKNTTDYNFPDGWGLYTDEQKDQWYKEQRTYRQAMRQKTVWKRKQQEKLSENDAKVDEKLK
jgi:hypothetical protein